MIIVHHLNDSRSQRVLWLLEELGQPYEIVFHQRDATTRLAPPELKAVHALGKSPVVVADGETIVESGAIVELLIERFAPGRLAPPRGTADYARYVQLLHYAEGSAMLPLMLKLYTGMLGAAAAPLQPRIESEIANHLGWLESLIAGRAFFVGDDLTGADIQLSFVLEAANQRGGLDRFPGLLAHMRRLQARPAYARALERGGPYSFAK